MGVLKPCVMHVKGKRSKKSEAKAMDVDEAPLERAAPEGSPGTRSRSLRSTGEPVRLHCLL